MINSRANPSEAKFIIRHKARRFGRTDVSYLQVEKEADYFSLIKQPIKSTQFSSFYEALTFADLAKSNRAETEIITVVISSHALH